MGSSFAHLGVETGDGAPRGGRSCADVRHVAIYVASLGFMGGLLGSFSSCLGPSLNMCKEGFIVVGSDSEIFTRLLPESTMKQKG